MLGTVREEAYPFIFLASPTAEIDNLEYVAINAYLFGLSAYSVLEKYPIPGIFDGEDLRPLLGVEGTDYVFACLTRRVARAAAAARPATYLYQFDHVLSFDPWGSSYPFCVGHGTEAISSL